MAGNSSTRPINSASCGATRCTPTTSAEESSRSEAGLRKGSRVSVVCQGPGESRLRPGREPQSRTTSTGAVTDAPCGPIRPTGCTVRQGWPPPAAWATGVQDWPRPVSTTTRAPVAAGAQRDQLRRPHAADQHHVVGPGAGTGRGPRRRPGRPCRSPRRRRRSAAPSRKLVGLSTCCCRRGPSSPNPEGRPPPRVASQWQRRKDARYLFPVQPHQWLPRSSPGPPIAGPPAPVAGHPGR